MMTARQKKRALLFVALILTMSAYFAVSKFPLTTTETVLNEKQIQGKVAGVIDGIEEPNSLFIRIPTNITSTFEAAQAAIANTFLVNGTATFNGDVIMNGRLQLPDDVEAQGITLNLGEGTILASNLIYSVESGSGILISEGQTPTITNTGVLSLQGSTGSLSLEAGDGIELDGLKISSTVSQPSIPNFFSIFAVPSQSDIEPDSTEDTITFVPGTGITITTNNSTKEITFNSTAVSDPDTIKNFIGFEKNGSVVSLYDSADNVGLGTDTPSQKLDVSGAIRLGAAGANNILNTSAAGGAPTGVLYWGDRQICDSSNNCGGGGSSAWSSLTNPATNLALSMAAYTTTLTYNNATGSNNLFNIIDSTSNSGTGYLFTLGSAAGSSANPIRISAQSNNVFIVDSSGLVSLGSTIKTGLGAQVTSDLGSTPDSDDVNLAVRTGLSNGNVVRVGFFENTDLKSTIESGRETSSLNGYLAFKTRDDTGVVNEAMRISASGNVGVGTTVPGQRFAVGTASQFQVSASGDIVRIKNLTYSWPGAHGSPGAVLMNDGSGSLTWSDTSSTAGPWASSGNDVYPDTNLYNVSIGTNVPLAKFHVVGTSLFSSTATFQDTTVVSGNSQTLTSGTSLTGGTIASSGNIEVSPTDSLIVGNDYFIVDNTGNVGIGTSTINSKFEIQGGDLRLSTATNYIGFALPGGLASSQTYTLPLFDGNDGDVLTTDSNGVMSWEPVVAGPGGTTLLSDISAADATNTINNANFSQVWNWQLGGTNTKGFTFGESAASGVSGDAAILYVNTLFTSAAVPLHVANLGGAYSFRVDDVGSDTTPFIIDASGNVGIGTTSSGTKLEVIDGQNGITPSAKFSHDVRVGTANTNGGGLFFGSTNYGYTAADYIRQTAVGSLYFYGGGTSARATQLVVSNGNVGVGTTAPANMFAAGSTSQFQVSSTGDLVKIKDLDYVWPTSHGLSNYVLTNNGSGGLTWSAVSEGAVSWSNISAPSDNLSLSMAGYTTAFTYGSATSTSNLFTLNDADNNMGTGYLFNLKTGTGSALNPLRVTTNNDANEAIMVNSGGNVGMGTTNPGSKLDVKGTFRLSGSTSGYVGFTAAANAGGVTYTWPSTAGSNGYILTSNGSGALSWTSIAAGGGDRWGYSDPVVYLSTISEVVHIGGTDRVGKLGVTGSLTSEPVLYLKGPNSITSPYLNIVNGSDQTVFAMNSSGNLVLATANGGFQTSASNTTKVLDFSTESTGVNYLRITNSNNNPAISVQQQGGATNVDMRLTPLGTGDVNFTTGGLKFTSNTPTIKINGTTSALSFTQVSTGVSYFNIETSNGPPQLQVQSTGTDVDLRLSPKGTGDVTFSTGGLKFISATPAIKFNNGTNGLTFSQASTGVNYFTMQSSNGPPQLQAQGTGTDVSIRLAPKGTGGVEIVTGSLTASTGNFIATGTGNNSFAGNTGLGTTVPATRLHVNGQIRVDSLAAASATDLCINTSILSSCSSSTRYKHNIQDLPMGLETVMQLRPVTFDWNNTNEADLGFVAEEVEQVSPLLATYLNGQIEGVKYKQLTAVLINAVQEQQAQISALQTGTTSPPENPDVVLRSFLNQFISFAQESLTFVKTVTFQARARFEDLATFVGQAVFKNKVFFEKEVVFASQMGGQVQFQAGTTSITVPFAQAFSEIPVITVTPKNFITGQYRITQKTTQGFVIELSTPQSETIEFDWQALRLDSVETTQSSGSTVPPAEPENTPPPTPEPTPQPTPQPTATPEATPTPTAVPTQSPEPSVSPEPSPGP